MATFTKIPDTETPVVSVNHLNKIAKINDNVYGGFTEYVNSHELESFTMSQIWLRLISRNTSDISKGTWDAVSTAVFTNLEALCQTRMASARM